MHEIIPDAQVLLFGSRANNTFTKESDWDILVLTKQTVSKELKKQIHEKVFPLSVEIGAFINLLVVKEDEWVNNPSYYSLRENILQKLFPHEHKRRIHKIKD